MKLTRTILLVPVAIAAGLLSDARFANDARPAATGALEPLWRRVMRTVPWFVVGFVALAALNSFGAFAPAVAHGLTLAAGFFIVMVLAAVGLNVDIAKIRRMGLRPLGVGVLLASVMACVSIALITALRIG